MIITNKMILTFDFFALALMQKTELNAPLAIWCFCSYWLTKRDSVSADILSLLLSDITEKLKGDECDYCRNKWRSWESESNNHTYHTFVSVVLLSIQIGVSAQMFLKSYLEAKCSFISPSWIIWRHHRVFKLHLNDYYLALFESNLSNLHRNSPGTWRCQ